MRLPYLVLKSLKTIFKTFKNEEEGIEMSYNIARDELAHLAKKIKKVMKFNKRFYKNQESGKGKRLNEQTPQKSSNDKGKGSSKGKKIECFNYRGLRQSSNDCPSSKDVKKFMQATWSDIDFKKSASTTSEDTRYDLNDFLVFITLVKFVYDSDCDSDYEFANEQMVEFLSNLIIEHKKVIKSYLKDHNIP